MGQTQKVRHELLAKLAVVIGITFASGTGIIVKKIFAFGTDTLTVIALRMLFTLPLFIVTGLWYYRHNHEKLKQLNWELTLKIGATGLLGYYLTSYTSFIGLEYITASLERIVMFVYPTILLVLSAVFLGKRIQHGQLAAIFITYIGLVISFSDQLSVGANANLLYGVGMVLLSAFLFSLNLLISRELIMQAGAVPVTVISLLFASAAILIQYFISHDNQLLVQPSEVYIHAGVMAVFTTYIPAMLLGYSLKHLSAVETAILTCIGPAVSFVLAGVFLGEVITLIQIGGSLIVILGVLAMQLGWDVKGLLQYKFVFLWKRG